MADRLDGGEISLPPSAMELKSIEPLMKKMINMPQPNLVRHIYKVRRGKLTRVRVWQLADLGTCRTIDLFVTTNNYELIPVTGTEVLPIDSKEAIVGDIEKIITEHSVVVEDEFDTPLTQEEEEEAVKSLFNW